MSSTSSVAFRSRPATLGRSRSARSDARPLSPGASRPGREDFDGLFRLYSGDVARWARRLGGTEAEVDDVVQEVFMAAHNRLHDLSSPQAVRVWLYRAASHLVRRWRVRQHWQQRLRTLPTDAVATGWNLDHRTPHEALESRQATEKVLSVLNALPERQRNLLVLFEIEERPGDEIARMMNMKVGTVWVYLHRAREQLSRRLEAAGEGRGDREARDP